MLRMHESLSERIDQDASVVPGGAASLDDMERRLAPYCERAEPRQRAMADLRGLLSPAERKNSWQLADVSGDATPDAFQHLLRRALAAGVPAKWVTGDRVYGDDRRLRMWLEAQPQAYVLAGSGTEYVWWGWRQRQVKTVLAALPEEEWARLRAGEGAKGPRWYDWCWRPLADPVDPAWRRWLLVRRSISEPAELRASVAFAPQATTMAEVVRVAGARWTIESSFEAANGEVGLDDDEVRHWTGW
jgi:SRSO17 transposase